MMSREIRNRLFSALAVALVLLGYQNCTSKNSGAGAGDDVGKQLYSGNGTGYDGMVYQNRLLGSLCSDGSDIRSEITVNNGQATLVRDNCQNVTDQILAIDSLGLYPHNESNLIFKDHVFDQQTSSNEATVYLCRAHYKMDFKEGEYRVIGDFLLKTSDQKTYTSEIKFGIYNYAMNLTTAPFDSGEISLKISQMKKDDHSFNVYDSTYTANGKSYNSELQLRMDNLEGWLQVGVVGATASTALPSVKDPPQFGFRVLCYPQ